MTISLDNAFWPDRGRIYSLRNRVELIAAAGYQGISCNTWMYSMRGEPFWPQIPHFADWGCPLRSVYMSMPAGTPHDGKRADWVREALDHLPPGAHLELSLEGVGGDPAVLDTLRTTLATLADYAASRQRQIALYPHTGYWLNRVADAVALCASINHPALRLCFPSSHWLTVEGGDERLLIDIAAALPWLISANLCGGRRAEGGWRNCLLEDGHFDATQVLYQLRKGGFTGEITVQHWDAGGDPWSTITRNQRWMAEAEARVQRLLTTAG
jgi:sugar phosphate isomerase/epimerase